MTGQESGPLYQIWLQLVAVFSSLLTAAFTMHVKASVMAMQVALIEKLSEAERRMAGREQLDKLEHRVAVLEQERRR